VRAARYHIFTSNHIYNTRPMGFYLPMTPGLPTVAAALCLSTAVLAAAGCATTTSGTAAPATAPPMTTAETLPALLLSAADVGSTLAADDVVVTSDVTKPWNDSAHFTADSGTAGCLAVAGAAQQGVYADSGWTALHGQVLREPPTAQSWSHYAVQAVVLFPSTQAAADFYARSKDSWAGCSNRELAYAQQLAPDQLWSIGPATTDSGVLAVSRVQRGPQQWSCQRALTVHGAVGVDVEACSLDGPTAAAASIARAIAEQLPDA
jgi:hypothetical protein